MIPIERFQVKIDPAVFEKITIRFTHLLVSPDKGYDEVLCEGDGIKVFMTLWFTDEGYHSIIWDEIAKYD